MDAEQDPAPNVAVIMPVHNAGRFLRECMDSVLGQTFRDFILLVCDDGSDDDSLAILEEYAARDKRVHILKNEKKQGVTRTCNKLLAALPAECVFLARMDADDVCMPDRLERQVRFLTGHPEICGISSSLEIIDEQSRTIGYRRYPVSPEEIRIAMPDRNVLAHPALMIRRAAMDEVHGYSNDPACVCCQDYECWLRLLDKHEFANLPDPVLKYRMSSSQCKQSKLRLSLKTSLRLQRAYRTRTNSWTFRSRLHIFAGYLLLCLPSSLILKLFEATTYRKTWS